MRFGRSPSSNSLTGTAAGTSQPRDPRSADYGAFVSSGQKSVGNDLLLVARHSVQLAGGADALRLELTEDCSGTARG